MFRPFSRPTLAKLFLGRSFPRRSTRNKDAAGHGKGRKKKTGHGRARPVEWEEFSPWRHGGSMFPDRKTRSDHRYQLSRRYPSVIRTLSGTLSTSAHPVLHERTLSPSSESLRNPWTSPERKQETEKKIQGKKERKRENDSTLNTKVRCCRLLLQTKWFPPRKRVVFTNYFTKEYLSLTSNLQFYRIDLSAQK